MNTPQIAGVDDIDVECEGFCQGFAKATADIIMPLLFRRVCRRGPLNKSLDYSLIQRCHTVHPKLLFPAHQNFDILSSYSERQIIDVIDGRI
jgi:hypothetical protein